MSVNYGANIFISRAENSEWLSCRQIEGALKKSYRLMDRQGAFYPYSSKQPLLSNLELVQTIRQQKASSLFFFSHQPHPLRALRAIEAADVGIECFIFHLYGDFTLLSPEWISLNSYLTGKKCYFFCGSNRHRDHLSSFFNNPRDLLTVPFPIETGTFYYSPGLRRNWRERLKIGNNEKVLVFAGRITEQKNIKLLVEIFSELTLRHHNLRLLIAGKPDNYGVPQFGCQGFQGAYYQSLLSQMETLPSSTRSLIQMTGQIDSNDLNGIFNAADVFVSFGLTHDEDFGLAPAQALCSGLPVCLADWGGYRDHAQISQNGRLVPVRILQKELSIDRESALQGLEQLILAKEGDDPRQQRSQKNTQNLSIKTIAKQLEETIAVPRKPFSGFSPTLFQLAIQGIERPVLFRNGPEKVGHYGRMYEHYC